MKLDWVSNFYAIYPSTVVHEANPKYIVVDVTWWLIVYDMINFCPKAIGSIKLVNRFIGCHKKSTTSCPST